MGGTSRIPACAPARPCDEYEPTRLICGFRLVAVKTLVNFVDLGISVEFGEFGAIFQAFRQRDFETDLRRIERNFGNRRDRARPFGGGAVGKHQSFQSIFRPRDIFLRRIDILFKRRDLRIGGDIINRRENAFADQPLIAFELCLAPV